MTRLERHLTFLATTAAVAPFVGLFGTVWGVMTAFMGMANADRTTIQAVAPGIAEALIATAFGLFAAIPAVMAYNHFLQRIRIMGEGLDDLKAELVAVAEERGI
jgi:biopolymer transport protein TolQ